MLPKINRLRSNKDFINIFKNGKTLDNRFFRVKFLKNQKSYNRFGFIISTKILKKAALRNTLKRRLRAISGFLIKDLKSSFDIVIWPKAASTALNYRDLYNYLKEVVFLIR